MELLFIYGPSAVGELTVGELLSEKTGYGLFHNHLTVDLVRALFTRDHPSFIPLLDKTRLDSSEAAAEAQLQGLIFTFCHEHPGDRDFVDAVLPHRQA